MTYREWRIVFRKSEYYGKMRRKRTENLDCKKRKPLPW